MTLLESFVKDEVFIDFDAGMIYGSDQCFDDHPSRFPTVGFQLIETNGLGRIADRIRKDLGFAPMHPLDEYTEELCDPNGWYDFFVGINGYTATHMDNCIEFIVVNSDSPDDEERYTIDLTEEEQKILFACLDSQCKKYLEKSCEELLTEAGKQMEEDYL